MKRSIAAVILLKSFYFLLLGVIATFGQIVTNSTKVRSTSSASNVSSIAAFKCLQPDDDDRIQESLISPKNYYNISRAIYPSIDVPSSYVKITVQFSSSTTNDSFIIGKLKRYTWSKSCLYVATQFVCLYAMNVYSLGTIWPNRRQTELFITLPEFCNSTEEDVKNKMIYFLSTLEDIAVIPTSQDPRLNTAECVVLGHDNFDVKIFSGSRKLLMCVCWCILIFSVVLGSFVSNFVVRWLQKKNSEELDTNTRLRFNIASLNFLIWVVSFFEEALIIVAVVLASYCGRGGVYYPVIYLIAVHILSAILYYVLFEKGSVVIIIIALLVLPFTSVVAYLYCKIKLDSYAADSSTVEQVQEESNKSRVVFCLTGEKKRLQEESEKLRNTMIYFTFQTTSNHLLWILQGVMTEPLWAIPVLAVVCGVWAGIYLLAYFYHDSELKKCYDKVKAFVLSFALFFFVVLQLFALGVVAQSFLSTNPLTGIASSVLTVVGTWWLQRVIIKPKAEQTGAIVDGNVTAESSV